MASGNEYLTFSPSTSSSRSILVKPFEQSGEPSDQSQEPLEWSHEQMECSQEPSEQSKLPSERSLPQENRKWPEEKIQQVLELASKQTERKWDTIAAAVDLSRNTCHQIWNDWQRQCKQANRTPKPKPKPMLMRRSVYWSRSEDEMLLKCIANREKWDQISDKIPGRSPLACRMRHYHLL